MSRVTLNRPWLEFDLGAEMQVLSWAINRPGYARARRILWREVRNADLPPSLDVDAWLSAELDRKKALDAVTFLTSRNVEAFTEHVSRVGEVEAHAVATVGFSNAERVGHRIDRSQKDWGTINVALRVSAGLTDAAMLEATSIAVQARTAAVMDTELQLTPGIATGTGTDCVAVACLAGNSRYAGLHTEIGEAAGHAVYTAVLNGARHWMTCNRETDNASN